MPRFLFRAGGGHFESTRGGNLFNDLKEIVPDTHDHSNLARPESPIGLNLRSWAVRLSKGKLDRCSNFREQLSTLQSEESTYDGQEIIQRVPN